MWSRRRDRAEDAARADAVQAASALAVHLQGGGSLVPVQADGLALAAGEVAFADVVCSAARFYGTDVDYPTSASGYFEDHPTFGRRWVTNGRLDARRRQEAEDAALAQWRDHTAVRVALTSAGVRLLPVGAREWMPFDHALLTGVTAEPPAVVLSYSTCAPLLLTGPAAPWLGVAIEHLHHGSA
ncbi:hypothetical protein PUR57_33220 [Streptomyces sp. JV176]|uniref:hypothetical protein n=1 Tax=Streptomyces sp. JV176 TaxID=858630 RepID=UPI002E75B9F0|nr:hypothetical protein [Streptomyces sp. JV176]MEE1803477.1 hypothetical protein [Streptomyces sp. JV176]